MDRNDQPMTFSLTGNKRTNGSLNACNLTRVCYATTHFIKKPFVEENLFHSCLFRPIFTSENCWESLTSSVELPAQPLHNFTALDRASLKYVTILHGITSTASGIGNTKFIFPLFRQFVALQLTDPQLI